MHLSNVKFCDIRFDYVWVGGEVGDGVELLVGKPFEKGFCEI